MGINVNLLDGFGNKTPIRVSRIGQLIIAPFSYDETSFQRLDVADVAFNFYGPIQGQQFVITGLVAVADIIGNAVSSVVFYEADSKIKTTPLNIIYEDSLGKGERTVLLPLNILTSPNVFINATTTEETIKVTVMGYYIPEVK